MTAYHSALKKQRIPLFLGSGSERKFIAIMARFIWRFHYIGTILLLILLVTASPQQFDTASTVDLGDSAIQLAATSLNPDPDALLDTQGTLQPQNSDLLAQQQSPDDNAFTPPLVFLSPQDNQIAETNSQLNSGSCPTNANSKPGASRLLRRAYGEFKPCCDPVNLGLAGPFNWIFGSNSVEERSPYCCEGGGIEYAPMRFCVPWNKAHQLCQDPDNWSCCIYGGSIFNGKVDARHCWSFYPPAPVKKPQPAQHPH